MRSTLAFVMGAVLLLGSCSSPPENMIVQLDVRPVPPDTALLVVWLCLNDKPAHEGALKIASDLEQLAIVIKSAAPPSGTLAIEVDALDQQGVPIAVGLVNQTVQSGAAPLTVPIALRSPVSSVGCSSGMCLTCTPPSQQIGCQLSSCASGACCDPNSSSCVMAGAACSMPSTICTDQQCIACGELGQPCCAGGISCSSSSTVCASGGCIACGGLGQPCCAGSVSCSDPGTVCANGSCAACGGPGQPCCAANVCSASGCCDLGASSSGQCVAQGSFCAGAKTLCFLGQCS